MNIKNLITQIKTMNDFEHWFDLLDFAMQSEIHCAVYDHKSKVAKIFEYDEDDDWIHI